MRLLKKKMAGNFGNNRKRVVATQFEVQQPNKYRLTDAEIQEDLAMILGYPLPS
jgi:hypothetical protein